MKYKKGWKYCKQHKPSSEFAWVLIGAIALGMFISFIIKPIL